MNNQQKDYLDNLSAMFLVLAFMNFWVDYESLNILKDEVAESGLQSRLIHLQIDTLKEMKSINSKLDRLLGDE